MAGWTPQALQEALIANPDLARRNPGEAGRLVPRFPPDYAPSVEAGKRATPQASKRASKFGNVPTDGAAPWGGMTTYPSVGHARAADRHAQEKAAGLIRAWSLEPSIVIGKGPRGYRRHKVDFIAELADGRLRLTEFKGFDHADGKQRRADLEAMGFVVEVVS
jgi:hypothetical protein